MEHRCTLRPTFLFLAFALLFRVSAQFIFVPDVDLRAAINANTPGAVNVSGYIDMNDPVVLAENELYINVTWSPVDLTGIEAFTSVTDLTIYNSSTTATLTVPAWPPAMEVLWFYQQFYTTSLPAFPSTLNNLSLSGITGLSTLPALPAGLQYLTLYYLPDLPVLPVLPAGLQHLTLWTLGIGSLPALPASITQLMLISLPITDIPNWPSQPDEITVSQMSTLTTIPPFPVKVGEGLSLTYLNALPSLGDLPDTCTTITLDLLPSVQEVPELPVTLSSLAVSNCVSIACLPKLPNGLAALTIENCPNLLCLPNWPVSLPYVQYDVTQATYTPGQVCTALSSSCPPAAAAIAGTVYHDLNANGTRDPGEPGYANASLTITPGGWTIGTDADGYFIFGVDPGTYSVSCNANSAYVLNTSPASHAAALASVLDLDTLNDFGVVLQPGVEDLAVNATFSQHTTGNMVSGWITSMNMGTIGMNGQVRFTVDPAFDLYQSIPAADSVVGNVVWWNFAGLMPSQVYQVVVHLTPDAGLVIGAPVSHVVDALPTIADPTPTNNTSTHGDTLVGPFDPNDKQLLPAVATPVEVAAGLDLSYTIRFQNTGNWPASRVIISDTLSTDLQWNTFEFVASSHACTWYVQNGVAVFTFDPINLPDSGLDEPGSHGFVKFRIEPSNVLPNGASVHNEANIWFDSNAPVITEPCVFSVNSSVGVLEVPSAAMLVYPNPAEDVLNVVLDEAPAPGTIVHVHDVTGRVVLRAPMRGVRTELPIQGLKAGAYRVEVAGGQERWNAGFIKR